MFSPDIMELFKCETKKSGNEKREAQQDFEEIKEELSEDYSGNDITDEFALYIISRVEEAFENAD